MLLENKVAIIYGGGGQIGRAVALAYAAKAPRCSSRDARPIRSQQLPTRSGASGGTAESDGVDALDEAAVDQHADAVAQRAGRIDISFNLISHGDVQGTPLAEMNVDDYVNPVITAVRSQFLTGRAAARHMVPQQSGVILMFGGDGGRDPIRDFYTGGHQIFMGATGVAFGALDVMRRQLARRARTARDPGADDSERGRTRDDRRGLGAR